MLQADPSESKRLRSLGFNAGPVTLAACAGVSTDEIEGAFAGRAEGLAAVDFNKISSSKSSQVIILYRSAAEVAGRALESEEDVAQALSAWRKAAQDILDIFGARRRNMRLVSFAQALQEPGAFSVLLGRTVTGGEAFEHHDPKGSLFDVLGGYHVSHDRKTLRLEQELEALAVPLGSGTVQGRFEDAVSVARACDPGLVEASVSDDATKLVYRTMVSELRTKLDQQAKQVNAANAKLRAQAEKISRISKYEAAKVEAERAEAALREHIAAIHTSTSWFLTKPVRFLGRLARRFAGQR